MQPDWTDEAQRWLQDVYQYIAADDPRAATRTVRGIYDERSTSRYFRRWGTATRLRPVTSGYSYTATHRSAYLVKDDGMVLVSPENPSSIART